MPLRSKPHSVPWREDGTLVSRGFSDDADVMQTHGFTVSARGTVIIVDRILARRVRSAYSCPTYSRQFVMQSDGMAGIWTAGIFVIAGRFRNIIRFIGDMRQTTVENIYRNSSEPPRRVINSRKRRVPRKIRAATAPLSRFIRRPTSARGIPCKWCNSIASR